MEKIDNINLASQVAVVEKNRADIQRADNQAKVNKVIDTVLTMIFEKTKAVERDTKEMVSSNSMYAKRIGNRQEEITLLEKRLEAIKSGNWEALDHNFGKPKPAENEISVHFVDHIDEALKFSLPTEYHRFPLVPR